MPQTTLVEPYWLEVTRASRWCNLEPDEPTQPQIAELSPAGLLLRLQKPCSRTATGSKELEAGL